MLRIPTAINSTILTTKKNNTKAQPGISTDRFLKQPHKKNGPSEGFVAKNGKNKTGGLEKVGLTIEPKIVATTRVKNGGLGKQVTVELG